MACFDLKLRELAFEKLANSVTPSRCSRVRDNYKRIDSIIEGYSVNIYILEIFT